MSRIVSVWLRAWPIARLLSVQASGAPAEDAVDPRRPLVLVASAKGGARVVALNRAAQRAGLTKGELLSNARSKVLDLQTRDADPAADAAALRKLALWCLRYTPIAAPWDEACGADGLFLDITGCAHLFGGEQRLLADLSARLRAFGLVPRLAVADTAGAAWAVARHGGRDGTVVAPSEAEETLQALPLAALRLGEEGLLLMRRLGLRSIGEVMHQPRAPFAARFHAQFLHRLDQALGRTPELLVPVSEPPAYRAQAMFLEPIHSQEHVLEAATRLLETLAPDLERAAVGARLLRLLLFKVGAKTPSSKTSLAHDAGMLSLDLGLAAPSRDPQHIAQLIGLRLHRLGSELETDFGFEAAAVHVLVAESLAERQDRLGLSEASVPPEELARLIDRLQQRLGRGAVRQLHPRQSHVPELAVRARPAAVSRRSSPSPRSSRHAESVPSVRREGRGLPSAKAEVEGWRQTPTPAPVAAPHPNPLPTEEWGEGTPTAARPLLLLERPEPAEVLAVVPDGPPRQFRWRGVLHQAAQAQGPERIAPEWWHRTAERTRDYYVVEDMEGRRFWLYRAGLYGQPGTTPQWFVHGVFG
jgi:protein ImuB